MKLTTILNGKERNIEIIRTNSSQFQVIVDGESHDVDAQLCSADLLSVLIDNCSYDISFSRHDTTINLNFRNRYFSIDVMDERRLRVCQIQSQLDFSGPEIIKTAMPGRIVKLMVEEGQKVEADTGVIIIEAMKMENEIRCRNRGTIKKIHVQADQTVEGDVALMEISPD